MAELIVVNNHYDSFESLSNILNYTIHEKIINSADGKKYRIPIPVSHIGCNHIYLGNLSCLVHNVYLQMYNTLVLLHHNYGQFYHHLVISFDSENSERNFSNDDIMNLGYAICNTILNAYQVFFTLHTNKSSHKHLHMVINSSNLYTFCKFADKKKSYERISSSISAYLSNIAQKYVPCKVFYNSFH